MNIGIIGAGQIGGALTRRFRAVGHMVAVVNSRGPDSLKALVEETGSSAVSLEDAVRGRDVIVLTIPMNRIEDLPPSLFAAVASTIPVIDTSNYYPQQRDGYLPGVEQAVTESSWVEQRIGHPVVKAFNSIAADHLLERGTPSGTPGRIALAVSGDDAATKAVVMDLIDQIGFDSVDAGPISASWRQHPGTPGYAKDGDVAEVRRTLAAAVQGRAPEWCATPNSPGTVDAPE